MGGWGVYWKLEIRGVLWWDVWWANTHVCYDICGTYFNCATILKILFLLHFTAFYSWFWVLLPDEARQKKCCSVIKCILNSMVSFWLLWQHTDIKHAMHIEPYNVHFIMHVDLNTCKMRQISCGKLEFKHCVQFI